MKFMSAALSAASVLAISVAQAAVIQGRVTEGSGSIGLEGASIQIVETGQTVTADRDGRFRISGLPAGEYTLEARYIGAQPGRATVTLGSEDAVESANIALGAFLEITDNILVIGQRGSVRRRHRSVAG